jgi:hypothetical protein
VTSTDASSAKPPASSRLRIWLILVTVLAVIGILAAIPGAFFATYMAAFAADDPSAPADAAINLMFVLWGIDAGFVVLQLAGVIGGWLAYRKRRNRLSFGLSLLAIVPIALIILAFVLLVVVNTIWSLSLLRT